MKDHRVIKSTFHLRLNVCDVIILYSSLLFAIELLRLPLPTYV